MFCNSINIFLKIRSFVFFDLSEQKRNLINKFVNKKLKFINKTNNNNNANDKISIENKLENKKMAAEKTRGGESS